MKHLVRSVLIFSLAIWVISIYIGGISFGGDPKVLLLASTAIALGNIIVLPLINLLLLPINILTLGSFKWLSSVFLLFIVSATIPGFSVHAFQFPGLHTAYLSLPSFGVNAFFAFILISFILNVIANFFFWLAE